MILRLVEEEPSYAKHLRPVPGIILLFRSSSHALLALNGSSVTYNYPCAVGNPASRYHGHCISREHLEKHAEKHWSELGIAGACLMKVSIYDFADDATMSV